MNYNISKTIVCAAQIALLFIAFVFYLYLQYTALLVVNLISFAIDVFFSFVFRKRTVILLLFILTIFLFLLGRPTVSMFRGDRWWTVSSEENICAALLSIELVLAMLPFGALLAGNGYKKKLSKNYDVYINVTLISNIRRAALFILIFGLIGSIADGLQKIKYMAGHTYVEYYAEFESNLPFVLKAFVRLLRPSMCLYLATFPRKKPALMVLAAYVFTTVPFLIVGMRSYTLLACLFSFTYFCLRQYQYPNHEKWIGKKEIIALIVAVPLLAAFAYAYNYIRQGKAYTIDTRVFSNFIYQQGMSFEYLAQGFGVLDKLPVKGLPGYMLGPSYDTIVHNTVIGRLLFGTKAIATQSMDAIRYGHDMKQHLSYVIMGDGYLMGYGTGSIFILEIIHDLGWLGLTAYSLFMGWLCVKISDWFVSSKVIRNTIMIYALLQLYYIARSDALVFLEHIVNMYFWFTLIAILVLSKLQCRFLKNSKQ